MTVVLQFAGDHVEARGYRSVFASKEDAMAQAVSDLQVGYEKRPVQIVDSEDETVVLVTRAELEDAAAV